LQYISEYISIPEFIFPPNSLIWVGASLLSSLNNEIDRFLLNYNDYMELNENIPDRFGDAFFLGSGKQGFFNKDFEINLSVQKQNLYSNTTPYSARSLASKKESIQQLLKKQLNYMDK